MSIASPSTRYQGSKRKLLAQLAGVFNRFEFNTALDLFSGSGSVAYLLRAHQKIVTANDYLKYNKNTADLFLSQVPGQVFADAKKILPELLHDIPGREKTAVRDNFSGIFFTDQENQEIDYFCANIQEIPRQLRSVLLYAVGQALLKKRPYNLFHRANLAMRLSDVERSFGNKVTWETSIDSHAAKAIGEISKMRLAEFPAGQAICQNTDQLANFSDDYDLVYLDPPYLPAKGKAIDYCDFYGFLDGLVDYELFSSASKEYPHRPLMQKNSAWTKRDSALLELTAIASRWPDSTMVFSYRGDGSIGPEEIVGCFADAGRPATAEVLGDYKYALAHSRSASEIVVVSPAANR